MTLPLRTRAREGRLCLLDRDPDLFASVPPHLLGVLRGHTVMPATTFEPGPWEDWPELRPRAPHGVLVVDGLVARRACVGGRRATELLGPGDPMRPWLGLGATSISAAVEWHVLEPTTVALLDGRFGALAGRFPDVASVLIDRLVIRAGWLAFQLAVCQAISVRRRVLAALWSLGDRWGRMTADGVQVPVRLTHETLGQVVGARRPSVTAALGELQRDGRVSRRPRGWVLHGEPPEDLSAAWAHARAAELQLVV